jgi:site-specific DNA-cytosine methylase
VAGPLDTRQTPHGHGMAGVNDQAVANNHVIAVDTYNQTVSDTVQTLRDPNGTFGDALPAISNGASVRRLTPRECERLQALPDDWTRVPDSAPDSRRYAALGDAVTATVAKWIGHRILEAA